METLSHTHSAVVLPAPNIQRSVCSSDTSHIVPKKRMSMEPHRDPRGLGLLQRHESSPIAIKANNWPQEEALVLPCFKVLEEAELQAREQDQHDEMGPEQEPYSAEDMEMICQRLARTTIHLQASSSAQEKKGLSTALMVQRQDRTKRFFEKCKRTLKLSSSSSVKGAAKDKQAKKKTYVHFNWMKFGMYVTPPVELLEEHKNASRVMVSGQSVPFTRQMHRRHQAKMKRRLPFRVPEHVQLYR